MHVTEECMKKYIICELDDAGYSYATYKCVDSEEEIRPAIKDYLYGVYKYAGDFNIMSADGYQECIVDFSEDKFEVFQIFEYDPNDGDWMCIYHHAYDGVGFEIISQNKTLEEAMKSMENQIDGCDDKESIERYGTQVIYDTGTEWCVWDIINLVEE